MSGMIAMTRFLRPKYQQMVKNWLPSACLFGTAYCVIGLYFTDWKVVMTRIPYIRGKFDEEDLPE